MMIVEKGLTFYFASRRPALSVLPKAAKGSIITENARESGRGVDCRRG